jgi:hypothetical protein
MKLKHLLFLFLSIPGLGGFNTLLSACELWELTLLKTDCNSDNKFNVKINFNYKDASNCFTVTGNGVNYGTFEYSQLPVILTGLSGDCHTNYEFQITDCNNKDCHVSKNLGIVCCPECNISNLKLEKTPCDSNDKFWVFLNFNHENTSHCFHLKINDHFYGDFEYASLPVKIGPLEGDCTTERVFAVYDCDKPDACNAKIGLDKVCCNHDCKLSNLKIEKTACDSLNMFKMIISFKADFVSDSFVIKVGDKNYGKFKYGNPAYKIGPFPGDCITKFKLLIFDDKNPQCATDTIWGPVCCGTPPEPCKLSELNVIKTDCDSDNHFYVDINFLNKNSSGCFNLFVNNDLLGVFNYADLPLLHVGPFNGDCKTEYVFLVQDCTNHDCRTDKSIGKVCCGTPPEPCKLGEFEVIKSDCDSDNHFFVNIKLLNKNSSNCFKLFVNNDLFGVFNYSDLPLLHIGPFNGDCKTDYVFLVKDCANPDCRIDKSIGKVCCGTPPEPCKLGEFEVMKSDCDSDNHFFVNIKLLNKNSSNCFKLFVNNDLFGVFNYSDLPLLHIGPFNGDCKTDYVFLIKDCVNPDCRIDKSIGKVCCGTPPNPCNISDLRYEKTECNDLHQFFLVLNFNHSNNADCFHAFVNGVDKGQFPYSSLPLKIGPFPGDCHTEYSLLVKDCVDPHCAADKYVGVVCCDSLPPCHLYDLTAERSDCDSNNQFYVRFNFKSSNSSDCFRIKGNGNDYGMHNYSDLPLQLGPFNGDCKTNYEFVIQDCKNERCAIEKNLGIICCGTPPPPPCKLSELKLEKSECVGDKQFYVYLNFKHDGTSECFRVFGNGHSYGEFRYAQLPLKLGPFLGDCVTNYEFGIEDCVKHDCHISANLGEVCCDSTNSKYHDFEMARTDCDSNLMFKLKIKFLYRDVSDSFNLYINGVNSGTYAYTQLPISAGPLLADCKTNYKINIIDQKDTTVRIERIIEKPCCHPLNVECKIYDIKANPQHCSGPGEYTLVISFRHRGTTNHYFEVFDRNGPIGTFTFSKTPDDTITIEHFKKSGHDFDLVKICENDNPACCSAVEFRTITCDSLINDPNKFNLSNLVINTNNASNLVSIFSEVEIPGDLEIEMFNMEGRQIPIDNVIRQPHEIFISSTLLTTELYFIRLKSHDSTKTYKFFHIR